MVIGSLLQVGEFKHAIVLRNLKNQDNTEVIEVHADVTQGERRSKVLQVVVADGQGEVVQLEGVSLC